MKKIVLSIVIIVLAAILFLLLLPTPVNEEGYEVQVLVENLDTPWAIDFLPDGSMIFTERPGWVSLYKEGNVEIIGTIDVSEVSESGLMGIAVDPAFETNQYIYVYYTAETGNRLSRFTLEETLQEETVLIDNIPNAMFHDGGRVKFGRDGLLYVTTGDATEPPSAQDIDSLAGKILRLNKDGSVPEDNPFENYVYSYGHRNPQGITWSPDGTIYASEHGPTRNDEINIIEKGENYGWPTECDTASEEFVNPLVCYTEFTLAPAGIAYLDKTLYVAGLRGTQLRKLTLSEDGRSIVSEEALFVELGRIRDVVEHDGYLYIATSNRDGRGVPAITDDRIIRISLQ